MSSCKSRDSSSEKEIKNEPKKEVKRVSNRISSKVWYFVVYPESTDIQDVITNACLGAFDYAIMLHDSDIDLEGKPKKPHYHVAIWRSRSATLKQIKDLFEISHAERPKYGSSLGDYITYMTHEKEPNKHQYPIDQLQTNVSRETLEKVRSSEIGLVEDKAEETLNDIWSLIDGTLSLRDFYMAHPRYLYNPRAVEMLLRQFSDDWYREVFNFNHSDPTPHTYQKPKFEPNMKGE